MRKNLAKHTAKKLPLAKRVLALCFALIFVCSCLLPAFANGTGEEFDTPDTEVVEAAAPGTEPEPMDLYDEPAAPDDEPEALDDDFGMGDEPEALDDDFAMGDEPAAMDDQVEKPVVDDEPAAMDDQVEKPVVDDEPAAMDNEVEKPVEGDEPPVADDTPAKEGATKTTTDASGNIVYEYDTSDTTFPDDDAAALPDGDQMQVDAAFSIPTNIYHFWLKKMSSYDLEDIARDAETAKMTVEQYLAMYGTDKGCYHIMTAADGANLKDYQFANPTSNDDPEGNSRTFAGWYYTDDLGDEQEFVFDEYLYVSESTTVEVYAKWKKPEATKSVTLDGQTISFKVEGATTLNVEALDTDTQKNLEDELIQKIDPKEYNTLYTFNISPKDEGGLELEQTSKVTISGLDLTSAADVKVFHQGSDLEELKVNVTSDGDLTFTTNGFSPFAILVADLSKANDSDSSDADDRMAELANEDKAYTVYSDGNSVEIQVNGTYTLSGNAYKPYWYTNYHSWSIESGDDVVSFTSEKNIQNPTIKGKSVGTAKLKHTYYIYYYNQKYSYQKYSYDEEFTINVTKFEDTYSGSAYIYFLKLPTGDPMNNDTGEWAPKADKSNLEAKISTADATWTNGYTNDNSAIPNKNIVTGNGQILTDYITSWPDGSTGTTWTVKKNDPTTGGYFTSIWNEISENYIASIKKDTGINDLTVDDITEIVLTPRKISRNNGGSQNYHIDCAISVVTKKVFTAKFMVKDPTKGEEKWSQVDSGNYKEGEAVIKTTAVEIGATKTVEGVRYELKGWYTEDPLGDINVHGPKIEDDEWLGRGTNGSGYLTKSTDQVREDGTVYFYAVWEPETQKPIRTITKKVEGLFGDRSKQFTIVVTGPNNFRQEFTLAHGETGTLNDLMVQVGDVITITEYDASDYDTTAQIYYGSSGLLGANGQAFTDGNEKTTMITITDDMIDLDEINITVINEKDAPVDNGVLLDTLPYILILVVVVGGGVLLFLRKRKNDDDE